MADWITRTSHSDEIPRLKEIWRLAFGDEDAYIDRFFELYYKPERCMTLHSEGNLTSAIHTFDMAGIVMPDGSRFSAGVTYALGTDPKYLGHDYGMKCMDASLAMQAELGRDCSIQVPANDTLFVQYHKRIGYCDAFYVREARIAAKSIPDTELNLSPIAPKTYGELREQQLRGLCHVEFAADGLKYQRVLCEDAGGGMYSVGSGCAVVEVLPDDVIFVKELLTSDAELLPALGAIKKLWSASEYIVRTPADRGEVLGGSTRRFAMAKFFGSHSGTEPLKGLNAYFGLAYD